MSLIARWTWSKPASAIRQAVVTAGLADAPVRVVGRPALAKVLAERQLRVIEGDASSDGSDANLDRARTVVAVGVGEAKEALEALRGHAESLAGGGMLVLVDRVASEDMTRLALNVGLVDLEQRPCGRMIVTSGRVLTLP